MRKSINLYLKYREYTYLAELLKGTEDESAKEILESIQILANQKKNEATE